MSQTKGAAPGGELPGALLHSYLHLDGLSGLPNVCGRQPVRGEGYEGLGGL